MDLGPAYGAEERSNILRDKVPIYTLVYNKTHQYANKQYGCNDIILLQQVHVVTEARSQKQT